MRRRSPAQSRHLDRVRRFDSGGLITGDRLDAQLVFPTHLGLHLGRFSREEIGAKAGYLGADLVGLGFHRRPGWLSRTIGRDRNCFAACTQRQRNRNQS